LSLFTVRVAVQVKHLYEALAIKVADPARFRACVEKAEAELHAAAGIVADLETRFPTLR